MLSLQVLGTFTFLLSSLAQWIDYPANGFATMTHYDLPKDYIASCGCTEKSTHYPTAALSQMAFGSSAAYGPVCGRCFRLTLLNTFTSNPPFFPTESNSVIVKVTDKCPLSKSGWCNGTVYGNNRGGHQLNFDLAFPSSSIPSDFFPSNVSLYGFTDFGVWNISYESITCDDWAGASDEGALGSSPGFGPESVCCPANPTGSPNDTCPSYSDANGIAPDTTTNAAMSPTISSLPLILAASIPLLVYLKSV
ncbi:endoglucanase v-like protein [Moniliophthora roreri MCA 2997]|uniref:Endoglucanase v-like protein n=2 Tax=Moniliophthora roreri TaxID=221103 RepID=V2XVF9_MONRO|nr:endoglucanase v-like protein [Moniliophthora roreri MCA 2997]KAI3618674.1 endoglucanase v-like protein [Moniliophthora roreri]